LTTKVLGKYLPKTSDAIVLWLTDGAGSSSSLRKNVIIRIFIVCCQACLGILTVLNIIEWVQNPTFGNATDVLSDLGTMVFLGVMTLLNRKGKTDLVAGILLTFLSIFPSIVFDTPTLDRTSLLFAIPILASSFMLRPGSSFLFAGLSILGYSANYFYSRPSLEYNIFEPILCLFMALISWLVSIQWDRVLARRRQQDVAYETLVETSPDAITVTTTDGKIVMANRQTLLIFGYDTNQEVIGKSFNDLIAAEDIPEAQRNFAEVLESGHTRGQRFRMVRKDRQVFPGEITAAVMKDPNGAPEYLMTIIRDIRELKKVEDDLRASERNLRQVTEGIREYIWLQDRQTHKILYTSPTLVDLLGSVLQESSLLPEQILNSIHPDDRQAVVDAYNNLEADLAPINIEFRVFDRNRLPLWVWARVYPVRNESGEVVRYSGIGEDITQRKIAEEALRQSEEKFSRAFYISPDSIQINRVRDGLYIDINQGFTEITGYSREDVLGKTAAEVAILSAPPDQGRLLRLVGEKGEYRNVEVPFRRKDGHLRTVVISARAIEVGGEKCILAMMRDIHDRKLSEDALKASFKHIELQVRRQTTLRAIDAIILANHHLELMIEEIINLIKITLDMDAVRILVPSKTPDEADTFALETLCMAGFPGDQGIAHQLQAWRGHALMAVKSQKAVYALDITGENEPMLEFQDKSRDLSSYAAAPLLLDNNLKGVFEVFCATRVQVDREWMDFFEALAMQLTIAITNAGLFSEMEKANLDLKVAYEETIAGWSRALELRDKETQGHSDRVTGLTIRLAESMSVPEEEIPHLRWGVLLHDIGKMGIPDQILLKPGPLTEDEWEIMRQHPSYARNLICAIPYLARAIDVPYCHHEKWDGTGYPRHLKGEEIPLAARIFSVVDVWDALVSDRPYRDRWPEEKVWEYLWAQSGRHFDPRVVDAFARLMTSAAPEPE
jgi:PAS domain S-box-containing protein